MPNPDISPNTESSRAIVMPRRHPSRKRRSSRGQSAPVVILPARHDAAVLNEWRTIEIRMQALRNLQADLDGVRASFEAEVSATFRRLLLEGEKD